MLRRCLLLAVLPAALAQRIKKVKDGDLIDMTGGRKQETQFSDNVIKMFNAISTNQPDQINAALATLPRGASM